MNLLIDFKAIGENAPRAAQKVVAALKRAGLDVVTVEAGAAPRRVLGVLTRDLDLTLADSQKLTLKVKETGDVHQVALNGKVIPIANQDNFTAAVKELVLIVDANRARFLKRLTLIKMPPPEGAKTAAPNIRKRLQAQSEELAQSIAAAREELAALA